MEFVCGIQLHDGFDLFIGAWSECRVKCQIILKREIDMAGMAEYDGHHGIPLIKSFHVFDPRDLRCFFQCQGITMPDRMCRIMWRDECHFPRKLLCRSFEEDQDGFRLIDACQRKQS